MKYLPLDNNPEFQRIRTWAEAPEVKYLGLAITYVAPAKPFVGMLVLADGATWNPGAGQGVYRWGGGVWNFLG